MRFGITANQFTKYGSAPPRLVEFVQSADELGFSYLRFLDHVVGIVAERHGGIAATPYTSKSYLHEPFTLFSYLAALTKQIKFVTGVLALPQRQTVLVAKQAAEVDILSGGRLRLGVGVGYNAIEFEAMGADFGTRGKMFEEQVEVLRKLWTEEIVTYSGRWHSIRDASLSPLPITRPIPLWFGMGRSAAPYPADAILERAGRLADGWMPLFQPGPEAEACKRKVHDAARAAGRDPSQIGMEISMFIDGLSNTQVLDEARRIRDFGATDIVLRWENKSPEDDLDVLKRLAGEVLAKFS